VPGAKRSRSRSKEASPLASVRASLRFSLKPFFVRAGSKKSKPVKSLKAEGGVAQREPRADAPVLGGCAKRIAQRRARLEFIGMHPTLGPFLREETY